MLTMTKESRKTTRTLHAGHGFWSAGRRRDLFRVAALGGSDFDGGFLERVHGVFDDPCGLRIEEPNEDCQ